MHRILWGYNSKPKQPLFGKRHVKTDGDIVKTGIPGFYTHWMLCRPHLKNLRVGDSSVLKYKSNKPESKLCNVLVVVIGSKVWKITSDSGFCGFGQKLVLPPTVLILTVGLSPLL